jgi:peptidoglycan/xylan/chitin deacetylase (PgdA/CDA1 family)
VLHALALPTARTRCAPVSRKLMILIYHRVLAAPDVMRPDEVDAARFRSQMAVLARFFNPLPLPEALQRLQQQQLPPRAISISFDDGYADNLLHALPILQRYRLPASFFITSGCLNGGRLWNDTVIEALRQCRRPYLDLRAQGLARYPLGTYQQRAQLAQQLLTTLKHRPPDQRAAACADIASQSGELPSDLMLSLGQLRQLHQAKMHIGGHTVSHPILTSLSAAAAQREIVDNKRQLEQWLQTPIDWFAYPNGKQPHDFTDQHCAQVKQAGFSAALTTHAGAADAASDAWQLPRFTPWAKTQAGFLGQLIKAYRLPAEQPYA